MKLWQIHMILDEMIYGFATLSWSNQPVTSTEKSKKKANTVNIHLKRRSKKTFRQVDSLR